MANMQFMTNGYVLLINLPNVHLFAFDVTSGKLISTQTSRYIQLCNNLSENSFYGIREGSTTDKSFQRIYKIQIENFRKASKFQTNSVSTEELFLKEEAKYLKAQLDLLNSID